MAGEMVLQLQPTDDNPRNSEGTFITFADGRIMHAYTRFTGGSGDHAPSDIAAVWSEDGGRTWTEPEIIIPNRGDLNTMSVSLLRLNDGRIMMSYLTKDRFYEMAQGNCRPWVQFSSDEGETWTEPKLIVPIPGYYVQNNDRIIQLSENHPVAPNRIIAPLANHRLNRFQPGHGAVATSTGIVIWMLSDDAGETWREAKDWWALPVRSESGLQEPGLVERKSGHLFSWARTSTGYQWGTTSRDGGERWEPFTPLRDFVSPNSPLSIKRIPSTGDLLAVWNDTSGRWKTGTPGKESWGRTPLVAAISSDDGATWTHRRLVESDPDHGYCYIAIHFVDSDDGEPAVLLAYCAGGKETGMVLNRLRMRRIPVSWLYKSD